MKQWWLVVLLLLSLGINLGLVAGRWLWGGTPPGPEDGATEAAPGDGETAEELPSDPALRSDTSPLLEQGAEAEGEPGRRWQPPPRLVHGIERMADDLRLEGERRRAFVELQHDFFERTVEARLRGQHRQRALRQELLSTEPDPDRATALLAEATAAQSEMEQAFLDNYFATRELLGPDQQRQFRRLMTRLRGIREELQRRRDRFRGPAGPASQRPGPKARPRLDEGRRGATEPGTGETGAEGRRPGG